MKKALFLPVLTLAGSLCAFALRLVQNRTGFDPATGLALSGHPYARALTLVLMGMSVLIVLASFLIPKDHRYLPQLPQDFVTTKALMLLPAVSGSFLLALSGALEAVSALSAPRGPLQILTLLLGAFTVLSGLGTASMAISCKPRSRRDAGVSGHILLMFPVVMTVRLVLTYRTVSVNPVTAAYYPEILAQIFLTLGFYRLSAFSFLSGDDRHYAVYAMCAMLFCLTALADTLTLHMQLLYLGGAVALAGFLLLRLLHTPEKLNHEGDL